MRRRAIKRLWLLGPIAALLAFASPAQALVSVGEFESFEGSPRDVELVGDFAYVAERAVSACCGQTRGGALWIFDLSAPAGPTPIGWHGASGAQSVEVVGTLAFLLDGPTLRLIDVSDPTATTELATFDTGLSSAQDDLVVDGGLAYVISRSSLRIINVSDPAALSLAGATELPVGLTKLALVGSRVYLATEDGLRILDTTDPIFPREVGSFPLEGGALDLFVVGEEVHVSTAAGLRVIDVSKPEAPVQLGSVATAPAYAVQVVDGLAYLAGDLGLQVVDVADPTTPQLLGYLGQDAVDVELSGGRAHLIHPEERGERQGGLSVIDVSEPAFPRELIAVDVPGSILALSHQLAIAGEVDSGSTILHTTDLTDPDVPDIIGSLQVPREVTEIVIDEDIAYLGETFGLRLVDVSVPATPLELAVRDTSDRVNGMAVLNELVFLVHDESLRVIDASNPSVPRQVGFADVGGSDVAVDGNRLYLVDGDVLRVVDISDPSAPRQISTHETWNSSLGGLSDIDSLRALVYSEDHVIDLSGKEPTQIATLGMRGSGLAISGNRDLRTRKLHCNLLLTCRSR